MFFITDSTFLIILYQIDNLYLIKKMIEICNTFILPEAVLNELTKKGEIISILGDNNKIQYNIKYNESMFSKISSRYLQLGPGEVSVLCIYNERNNCDDVCILDDHKARNAADSLRHVKHGTVWFIEECYSNKILTKEKTLQILRDIRNQNFWIDKKIIIDAIIRVSNS